MSMYDSHPFVEPTWYQPVEFLDISPLSETLGGAVRAPAGDLVCVVREDRRA
jgi:hypothetical protein